MIKRLFDIAFSLIALVVLAIPLICLAIWIRVSSPGPVLHWSVRIGKHGRRFAMPKFRTMRLDTPQVATHLLDEPELYVTPVGRFLRKYSLDELPQLFSILKGDMSFVGPRPALFNQSELIGLREKVGANVLTPGLTGWAQINGRDELPLPVKVEFDRYYLVNRGILLDLKILYRTVTTVIRREGVHH